MRHQGRPDQKAGMRINSRSRVRNGKPLEMFTGGLHGSWKAVIFCIPPNMEVSCCLRHCTALACASSFEADQSRLGSCCPDWRPTVKFLDDWQEMSKDQSNKSERGRQGNPVSRNQMNTCQNMNEECWGLGRHTRQLAIFILDILTRVCEMARHKTR